jgi:phospholipid N-methyltransferase
MRDALLFFKNFLVHPTRVGSLMPSSPRLVSDMLAEIDFATARLIVEYGPGTGVFTEELIRRLHPEARLVCIELGDEFHSDLTGRYVDPRVTFVHGSAAEVRRHLADLGLGAPDTVVSGLPFTSLPDGVRHEILRETCHVMQPDGLFLLYQYTRYMTGHLERYFSDIRAGWTLLNVPPAHRFACRAPRLDDAVRAHSGAATV